MKNYVLTVKYHPWLMSSIEDALLETDATVQSDLSSLARSARGPGGRPVSDDEVMMALNPFIIQYSEIQLKAKGKD